MIKWLEKMIHGRNQSLPNGMKKIKWVEKMIHRRNQSLPNGMKREEIGRENASQKKLIST